MTPPSPLAGAALAYARAHHDHYLHQLQALLRIPSISTQPAHRADIDRAADWLADHLRAAGLEHVAVLPTAGHPVVYADWLHAGADAPTLLCYGHYDVQPVDPLDAWHTPPFEPTVRGDHLVARGASDDKGQLLAIVNAVAAYLASSGRLPINVKLLIEGEEEISSPNVRPFVHAERARLAADAVLMCDDMMLTPEQPLIITGVRGSVYLDVTARGPRGDLHSGIYGGVVENPINVLARLLAGIVDPATHRITIPGFYDSVRPVTAEERERLNRVPADAAYTMALTGAPGIVHEAGYTPGEAATIRPTFEIHGIAGGYTEVGKKSVIPAEATAKLSFRLVPDQESEAIYDLVTDYLRRAAAPTVTLTFQSWGGARPAVIDWQHPALQAAATAYERGVGAAPLFTRGGGSLALIAELQEALGAPVVMLGFGLPDDNIHAPNEQFYLPNFYRGIETVIHYLDVLAGTRLG